MSEHNWAGNVEYRAQRIHRPASIAELRRLAATAHRTHVLGSRHSFSSIADSASLVSLRDLPGTLDIDRAGSTVTTPSALTYGELAPVLHAHGLALPNLASLPHISVGGALATATHGSGNRLGNLATAAVALELVTSTGELITIDRTDPGFAGAVVSLGALGAVTRITLAVEPTYEMRQVVYEPLAWDTLTAQFDAISAAGTSVSIFTTWGDAAGQIWVKRRLEAQPDPAPATLFDARALDHQVHPIPGADPSACTLQCGIPGAWHERLPHFRLEFTPSAGDELQSEYLLPRVHAADAIAAVRGLAHRIRPLLHTSEIRTVAADGLWLSPQYHRDTLAIHFTWRRDQRRVEALLPDLEAVLAPFEPRPHWGKLFAARADDLAARYERLDDFDRLRRRLDPRGAFRNQWLDERVLGA